MGSSSRALFTIKDLYDIDECGEGGLQSGCSLSGLLPIPEFGRLGCQHCRGRGWCWLLQLLECVFRIQHIRHLCAPEVTYYSMLNCSA